MSKISDYKTREEIISKRNYSKNIAGDKFSLYISSYPSEIKYLASRIGDSSKTVAELCCGIGVTLGIMTRNFKNSIGLDSDRVVLENCRENIKSLGLTDKCQLILGDVSNPSLLEKIVADVVIYDIPYWSPYSNQEITTTSTINPDLKNMVNSIKKYITKDIVIFASPAFSYEYLREIVGECEYQKIFIGEKYDRNMIYLGKLIHNPGITEHHINI